MPTLTSRDPPFNSLTATLQVFTTMPASRILTELLLSLNESSFPLTARHTALYGLKTCR